MSTGNEENRLLCICLNVSKNATESFNPIREWLDDNHGDPKLLEAAVTYQYICNMTPLHWILREHSPIDIVEKMIDIAPRVLCMKDNYGMLPLHVACRSGTSLDILQLFVKSYPESVHDVDNNGRLPLHHACDKGAPPETFTLLRNAHPKSVEIKDCYGKTPLDYASTDAVMLLLDGHHSITEAHESQLNRVGSLVIKKSIGILRQHIQCGSKIRAPGSQIVTVGRKEVRCYER